MPNEQPSSDLLARLDGATVLVESDPEAARRVADKVLELSTDRDARSAAHRLRGVAWSRLGHNRTAIRELGRAIQLAERAGLRRRASLARLSLVVVYAADGRFDLALAESDLAEAWLSGPDRGELLAQRGVALARLGDSKAAMRDFASALRLLDRDTQQVWRAGVHLNRGLLLTYRGTLQQAEIELERGRTMFEGLGLSGAVGMATQNLGFLATLRGDIPTALEWLDLAEETKRTAGIDTSSTAHDRAEALLIVGLVDEARAHAARAVSGMTKQGRGADLAEARLTLARAALAGGDPVWAKREARSAMRALEGQDRDGWAAIARHLTLRARWEGGERSARLVDDARTCADDLERAGWRTASLQARVLTGQVLLELGRKEEASVELARAGRARRHGPADLRIAAWHAESLLRLAHGDRRGALRAVSAGLDIMSSHAAALGATDLRAQSRTPGWPLAELGLNLVMERGRPREVLRWLERARTTVLRSRPARPPRDARLAADLAALRRVTSELTEAQAKREDTTELRRNQLRLERTIRDHARHARGARDVGGHLDLDVLAERLGARALVEYFWQTNDDRVHAVVLVGGRYRSVPLGSYDQALREAESLRFAMHRLASRHGSPESLAVARTTRDHAARTLDALLVEPLLRWVEGRELVVVPTMRLHALPWPALPSMHGRAVSVAPSAQQWLAADLAPRRRAGGVVLVAGPDLVFAEPEIESVEPHYPGATRLTGGDATADRVHQAIDGARIAHLACHGHFRTDNPQFSSLRLADGPLMVYDLERLHRAPDLIVLSACDAALSAVHPGDELVGLSSALFALGTRTLVASVNPVDDEAAKTLMIDFHARLATGQSPAHALADAQATRGVIGFACFGAG